MIYLKKLSLFLLLTLLFSSFTGCITQKEYLNKSEIFDLVEANRELILNSTQSGEYDDVLALHTYISDATAGEGWVDFYCGGHGLSVSGVDYGFYYSETDEPLPVHSWGGWLELKPDGDGWSCDSSDRYYTEKICDHLYYYEAGF
ncbi:MAG: hypothetical protein IJX76_01395 [Clostridia bacterium]|nr:hypothetical protein [Clostridia bacterium]